MRDSAFPERLHLMLPAGCNAALEALAARQYRTKSEVVRRAVLSELEAHGHRKKFKLSDLLEEEKPPVPDEPLAADASAEDAVAEARALVARLTAGRAP